VRVHRSLRPTTNWRAANSTRYRAQAPPPESPGPDEDSRPTVPGSLYHEQLALSLVHEKRPLRIAPETLAMDEREVSAVT